MLKTGFLTILAALLALADVIAQTNEGVLTPLGNVLTPQYAIPQPNTPPAAITVARLHYGGGGDWYWGSSALPNFLTFVRKHSNFPVDTLEKSVQITDEDLFRHPFLFATGHGIMRFSGEEKERLRTYLANGGFLFINDSYGMDQNLRKEIKSLFPERELTELSFDHPIYHCYYDFPAGPPKIHEHDNKAAQGFGVIIDGRVVLYYLYESDIGDGWEDSQVHDDSPEKREAAFKMGMNILVYAMTH